MSESISSPGFEFGIFEFDSFADWLSRCHQAYTAEVEQIADSAAFADVMQTDDDQDELDIAMARAVDFGYLAMLALAVSYSIREDVLEGCAGFSPEDIIAVEPVRRAEYMLRLHGDQLPYDINAQAKDDGPSIVEKRARIVGELLMHVAMHGRDSRLPVVAHVFADLPDEVQSFWQSHDHAEDPLCQLMVVAFWLGHMGFVDGNDELWGGLLELFWDNWQSRLLYVHDAILREDLNPSGDDDGEELD